MKLTIGMPCYKNDDEVWFTLQALRLYHDLEDTELLVIDNYGSDSLQKNIQDWMRNNTRYVRFTDVQSPAHAKNKVFEEGNGDWIICMDSHVLYPPGVIKKYKEWIDNNYECMNLVQGPLVYDNLVSSSDCFNDVWSGHMWGQWSNTGHTGEEPVEIKMNGCGFLSCRKDAWLGFSKHFKGFGAEEGYIHEKFRQAGRKCWSLSWLRWVHHFQTVGGKVTAPYKPLVSDRIWNYLIGFTELNLDISPIKEHFNLTDDALSNYMKDVNKVLNSNKEIKKVEPPAQSEVTKIELPESSREMPLKKDNVKAKLSVIIPYVNEYPQNVFTVASIHESLINIDHEIIVINNTGTDKGYEYFNAHASGQKWLTSLNYPDKLSHWQAKNYGVSKSDGDVLFFCDAHCIVGANSLESMYDYYRKNKDELHGTIHLPLSYTILEWRKLIYKLVANAEEGTAHYTFSSFRESPEPYEVPCMSTCGMMITRDIYNSLGGWPIELGIYGGGENFINFSLAVMGMKKWIYPNGILRHHGEKRGYSWNYGDYHRNRMIATYCFGGKDWLNRYAKTMSSKIPNIDKVTQDIIEKVTSHRLLIKKQQTCTIDDWLSNY